MKEMEPRDITLYTAPTMNGWKPLIFLEEAKVEYNLIFMDFSKHEQKKDWYLRLNPNGRIPTLVDHANSDFTVFESGAILWYLAEEFGRFIPDSPNEKSVVLQWLMFQMSAVGPMMGQAMFFNRIAAPKGKVNSEAIARFTRESRRILEVIDKRLQSSEYIAGQEYTIADMAFYPWVRSSFWAKIEIEDLVSLNRWLTSLDNRAAIQRALKLPEPRPEFFGIGDVEARIKSNSSLFKI